MAERSDLQTWGAALEMLRPHYDTGRATVRVYEMLTAGVHGVEELEGMAKRMDKARASMDENDRARVQSAKALTQAQAEAKQADELRTKATRELAAVNEALGARTRELAKVEQQIHERREALATLQAALDGLKNV